MTEIIAKGAPGGLPSSGRIILLLANFIPASCGSSSIVVTAAGSDGAYELTCQTSLPRCLERADTVCQGSRYEVLHATDDRAYRGPLDAFESENRSSSASIRCLTRGTSLTREGNGLK